MGREHARKGKHFLLYIAAGMMLFNLFPGCVHTYTSWQGREKLRRSELLAQRGDFDSAIAQNMEVYREHHGPLGDQALFQVGLLYAHPQNPGADHREAIRTFERLAEEFPHSIIRNEADVCAHILRTMVETKVSLRSLQAAYGRDRETLSRLQKEVREKKRKIARDHDTATGRLAAIEHLKAQISDLQSRLQQMEAQLSDLKKIDLMMEERRRKALP